MVGPRVLSLAAATGRIGHVFLDKADLQDWKLSRVVANDPEAAARHVRRLIETFRPDVVVTEKIIEESRKGDRARANIMAMAKEAANHQLYDIAVVRARPFKNKYLEAEALTERFPALLSRLPDRRKAWNSEPKQTVIFEALALALQVIDPDCDSTLF